LRPVRFAPRKPLVAVAAPTLKVERHLLACGALLLVSRRPGAPITAFHAHVRGGFALDPSGKEGLAFLAGALASEGTTKRSEEEIADLLEPAGGALSGDSGGIAGSIAGESWETLLEVASDVLTAPTYPESKFERQRSRLVDRLMVDRDDPRVQGGRMFRRLIYGDHWLGRSEQGQYDSVRRITRADLIAHHAKQWVASRAVIGVCGDVDPKAVRKFLDERLAKWPAGTTLPPAEPKFPPPGHRVAAFAADRQQVHLYLGHLGIRRSDPDYPALVVMDHILGTGPGFTSRIAKRLRDEEGLAYSVHSAVHTSAGVLPGLFSATIGTSPKHVERAVRGFVEEITRIRTELVAPAELDLVHRYLTGSFALGFERASRRTSYMVYAERHGLPPDHLEHLPRQFIEVDAEAVRRVADKHLRPSELCLVGAGPVDVPRLEKALQTALAAKPKAAGKKSASKVRASAKPSAQRAAAKPAAARALSTKSAASKKAAAKARAARSRVARS